MTIHVDCYKVLHPALPGGGLWTYEDYEAAFQHATGRATSEFDSDREREQAVTESEGKLTIFGWSR